MRGNDLGPFLVCHDYGMGGLWWWISAPSAEAITSRYRDITVFEQTPDWWNAQIDGLTPRVSVDNPDKALALLANT